MTDETTTESTTELQDTIDQLQAELTSTQAELATLQEQNETLEQKLKDGFAESPEGLKDLAGRAQADLQNAKERMERETRDIRQFALESTINKLLPTIDNFNRAFAHLPDDLQGNDWVNGVQTIEKDMMNMLSEAGLRSIEAVGATVDVAKHEVLQMGPGTADTVTEVFEQGYELNGRVLRPAKVKVGDGS